MGVETRLFFAKKEDVLADVPVGLIRSISTG